MGFFDLFRKKGEIQKQPPQNKKVGVSELMYAYMKRGCLWGDESLTWNMKNCYPGLKLKDTHKICVEYGIIRKATTIEKLKFASFSQLKSICNEMGLKAKRTKADTAAMLAETNRLDEISNILSEDVIELSDEGNRLIKIHDYIPYLVKDAKNCPFDYEKMWDFREKNQSADIFSVLQSGINESFISDQLFYDDWEEIDEDEYGMSQDKFEAQLRKRSDRNAVKVAKDLTKKIENDIEHEAI